MKTLILFAALLLASCATRINPDGLREYRIDTDFLRAVEAHNRSTK